MVVVAVLTVRMAKMPPPESTVTGIFPAVADGQRIEQLGGEGLSQDRIKTMSTD